MTTLKCGFKEGLHGTPCLKPSVCGLRHQEAGIVVNVCREHFRLMKDRDFGSDPSDLKFYREQKVLL